MFEEATFLKAWLIVCGLMWAMWWGGLSFYAIVVVPIGTQLIGSIEQGFITQRVTQWHNATALIFTVCLFVEAYRSRRRGLWLSGFALLLLLPSLFVWHVHLTSMMDFKTQTVPVTFYNEHAIYLWLTAAEWAIGIYIPVSVLTTKNGKMESPACSVDE